MLGLLSSYARAFNARNGLEGRLFERDRFGSRRIMGNADLLGAIAYVHLNPRTNDLRSAHTSDPYYRRAAAPPWWLSIDRPLKLFDAAGGYERYIAGTEWMRGARAAAKRSR